MFDIINSRDFYQKLLEDFDDYMQHQDSARHAMNCAITAHHMADWVWGGVLKAKLGVKDKDDFVAWIDSQTVWYGVVQGVSNGSKHFIREYAKDTHKIEGYGMGGYGQGPYGMSYLAIEVSATDPKLTPVAMLLEVVIRFWRNFLKLHGPYDPLPKGKVTLMDELLPGASRP